MSTEKPDNPQGNPLLNRREALKSFGATVTALMSHSVGLAKAAKKAGAPKELGDAYLFLRSLGTFSAAELHEAMQDNTARMFLTAYARGVNPLEGLISFNLDESFLKDEGTRKPGPLEGKLDRKVESALKGSFDGLESAGTKKQAWISVKLFLLPYETYVPV